MRKMTSSIAERYLNACEVILDAPILECPAESVPVVGTATFNIEDTQPGIDMQQAEHVIGGRAVGPCGVSGELHDDERAVLSERRAGTGQHLVFRALHVNLDDSWNVSGGQRRVEILHGYGQPPHPASAVVRYRAQSAER